MASYQIKEGSKTTISTVKTGLFVKFLKDGEDADSKKYERYEVYTSDDDEIADILQSVADEYEQNNP